MSDTIIDLDGKRPGQPADAGADGGVFVAVVTRAADGVAEEVMSEDGREVHAGGGSLASVSYVNPGDKVLALPGNTGVVAMGRLRTAGEGLPADIRHGPDGKIYIALRRGIELRAGASRLELTADGRVCVDGREIHQFASGTLALQGVTLKLN